MIMLPLLTSARYVSTSIDEFSRYTWVNLLKNKDHVFEQFNEFRALSKKQCNQIVKCLGPDYGGEYVGKSF